jgi:MFS transporter, FSR family, fosmidomycin resistance protein
MLARYRNPAAAGRRTLQAMSISTEAAPSRARQDYTLIGLIGLAHGTSHFFHMLLPPLFPTFIEEFSLSYSQLGLLVSLFFVISGIGQALAGFLVDRVGARPVLFGALGCFVAAAAAAATAQGYGGLVAAAALAGIGNSPFHPADFTILNKRVASSRLGHAFSAHGISGNLGWAIAPVFMIGATALFGHWRAACAGAGVVALGVLLLLVFHRHLIDDRQGRWSHEKAGMKAATAAEHPLAFLRLPSVWLCFSFFFWTTGALAAMQGFAGPALGRMYGLPLGTTAFVVTGYMLCAAAGMVAGGFLVGRSQHLERTIAWAMASAALLLLLVGTGWLPPLAAAATAALAGIGGGLAGPSRDMLIKRAAPPGATGRVYGTVYSGLDAGFALAAPLFGWVLDHRDPGAVFGGAALLTLMGVASAGLVALTLRRRMSLAAAS